MKTFIALFVLFTSTSIFAQQSDSSFYKYGLFFDVSYPSIQSVGFKYKYSDRTSFIVRGFIRSYELAKSDYELAQKRTESSYFTSLGLNYNIITVNNLLLYSTFSLGLTYNKFQEPSWYYEGNQRIFYTFSGKTVTYSLWLGIGAEYFFSKHLSIAGSQSFSFAYMDINSMDDKAKPVTNSTKKTSLGDITVTLTFYF